MKVLKLLESKNRCLNRFLRISEKFLSEARAGDLSHLNDFETKRDSVLKAIALYDRKISEEVTKLSPLEKTAPFIESVKKSIQTKDSIIATIFSIDNYIINEIEREKTRLVQELSETDKNHHLVMKFKSKWISESGETLDGKL
jgi:hypothetical protein